MKRYRFSGKYKKKNYYEKYYTNYKFIKNKVVPVLKKLQKKKKLPSALHFIDTSAGDGRLHEILKKQHIIKSYKAYDISPAPGNIDVTRQDWLKTKTKKQDSLIGFNPPYGYNNEKAKKFIKKGWNMQSKYAMWLVPKSVASFLNQYYKKISQIMYNGLRFQNKTKKKGSIQQSVILFIGERLDVPKILSTRKTKKHIQKYNINISRSHYKGIEKDVTFIIKKTGNPVLMPIFIKKGKYWHQYFNGELITKKATMVKKNGYYFIKGISKTKNAKKPFLYAIESNVYFKIKYLEKYISIIKLTQDLMKLSKKQSFYNMTNTYKPAAVTKEWFSQYLQNYIEKNKI